MSLQRGLRVFATQWQAVRQPGRLAVSSAALIPRRRWLHASRQLQAVKPVLLADIGEGIVECEIIQWFVEPGARVEEFSPLCEVQSDKASVEITSRFAGIVKKLYYDAGEMARVGKPFVDIDVDGPVPEAIEAVSPGSPATATEEPPREMPTTSPPPMQNPSTPGAQLEKADGPLWESRSNGKHASLATPAVRHLSKENNVDITLIQGTGKEGRVTKEDVHRFIQRRDSAAESPPQSGSQGTPGTPTAAASTSEQVETIVPLTKMQLNMFSTMTKSLKIPHFLYSDEVDFTKLAELRRRLNKVLAAAAPPTPPTTTEQQPAVEKLSYLPFIIKAMSLALQRYPVLNARVDVDPVTQQPSLAMRRQHNVGVAMDTPRGLVVPVVRDVASRNVLAIAAELARLRAAALAGRLTPADLAGGTVTVSNIGSIGGTYLSPVVVEREVAILGLGRVRSVPAFADDDGGGDGDVGDAPPRIIRREVCNFSWSADHRVVDGATMARAAEVLRGIVEEPDVMIMHLR